jgi:hypothetical protein
MMLSMSQNEMQVMAVALRQNYLGPFSYREDQKFMMPDFRQPDFYGDMSKSWGMDAELQPDPNQIPQCRSNVLSRAQRIKLICILKILLGLVGQVSDPQIKRKNTLFPNKRVKGMVVRN